MNYFNLTSNDDIIIDDSLSANNPVEISEGAFGNDDLAFGGSVSFRNEDVTTSSSTAYCTSVSFKNKDLTTPRSTAPEREIREKLTALTAKMEAYFIEDREWKKKTTNYLLSIPIQPPTGSNYWKFLCNYEV